MAASIASLVVGGFFLAGCAQPVVTTNPDGSKATNFVANGTTTAISSFATVAAPIVPQPYGAIIGALGILIGVVGTGIAGYQNGKANLHQNTLTSVANGVENAAPGIAAAITAALPAAASNPTATNALTIANTVLSQVKSSIASATVANGTAANLNKILAASGIGPSAA